MGRGASGEASVEETLTTRGEMLLRAMERLDADGVGIDPSFIATARAHRRVAPGRLALLQGRLGRVALPPGLFSILICTGATHVFGDFAAALPETQRFLQPNSWALFGQGYWQQTPAPEYLEAFGGSANELRSLAATKRQAFEAAWNVVATIESSAEDWDAYELSYATSMRRWLNARSEAPDAGAFAARIEQ